MWEVFKFLLLCLISIILGLTASFVYVCALLIVLVLVFYDFDFAVGLERHAINKFNNLYLKVRNFYTLLKSKTTHVHVEQPHTNSFLYTPTMNSINKQTSSFELSRFNKSGNALSPITNSASSTTLSSRRLLQARQTSTPLTKTPPWQQSATNSVRSPHINSSLMNRSPRYSLSSVNVTPKTDGSPKPTIQTVTGPLLASTRFNVNLGTYMDTKSPGLASRVVQYNNELSGEQTSTHQAKYGSPGQFPIVQLYKKELPILTRTPRRCTVRIAPPDPVSYSSDHASTILRDSFMQKNIDTASKPDQCDTEINTKSVLEALKEISRKRIHTNDDLEDISKRQRKNSINSPDHLNKDGKRMREDTPPKPKDASNTTPINSAPKRICVVNEIESSLSSSRLMRLQQGQKRKSTVNLSDNNKQRKISNGELISRETQTTITNGLKSNTLSTSTSTNTSTSKTSTAAQTETEKPVQPLSNVQCILESARRKKNSDRRTIEDIDEENSTLQFSERGNKKTTKPFFSEAPLEILKQNKLAVMLSALSGQKPEIIPLPVMTLSALKKRAEEDKTDGGTASGSGETTKEVVSILSPKNKVKHDKHVTFSIPNAGSDSNSKSDETTSVAASSPSTINTISFNPLSSQIVAPNPIQFPTPTTTSSTSISVPKSNFNFSSAITATSMPSPSNNISFGPTTTTTVSTNIITSSSENKGNLSLESQNKSSTAPTFNSGFGGLVPSSNAEKSDTTTKTTGFSISTSSSLPNLATTTSTSANMFGIGTSSSLTFPVAPAVNNNVSQPSVAFSNANPPTFGIATTTAPTSAPNTIGAALSQQPSILPTSNATSSPNFFNFGAKTDSNATPGLNASNTMTTKSGGFKFDLGNKSTTAAATTEVSKPPPPAFNAASTQGTFTFGATTTTSTGTLPTTSAVSFGTPISSAATTTSAPMFGATNTNAFGATNTSGFSAPSTTAKNLFGISTTAKTGVFNTNTTTANSGMFGSAGVFGNASTSTNSTPATTTSATSNVFGTATTTNAASGMFGSAAAPASFGAAAKPDNPPPAFGSFGTANTAQNTSGFRAFSAPTTTQNTTGFSAFGSTATTQANTFGSTPTTTAQNTTFGSIPATTQSNTFGSIATTTQSATFGAATAAPNKAFTFGSSTTPKEFTFGSSSAATTTASNVFGSATSAPAASNLFGGNASSAFRNPTTTPSNAFGATTTTTTASSTFGQSSSGVFGTANNASFNNNAAGSVFGGNNNTNNAFGSAAPSVFGATNQPSSSFAAPSTSNVFGANNNTNQTGNTLFGTTTNSTTFGSNTNAFGTSGFNNNNNNNANNATQPPSFGSFGSPAAQPAAAQASGVFAFGSAAPAAAPAPSGSNAFQFGGAAQTPKPGGFNFSGSSTPNINFGSGATPSFNASPAPAFGSPAPSGFNANTPATGMFNIGSGSTAPKQRPMIKARRRN